MTVRSERARRMAPAERREALIDATLPLVLWHGPGVTTRQIAEAAEIAAIDRDLPLRDRLVRLVEILQHRLNTGFTLINALGMKGPPPDGQRPRLANDQFRNAIVELVGDDRTHLRVPPIELATALRMLVFASTHPMINDGNPLTSDQIVGILLDGVATRGDQPC